ncbi:MAG TPA: hypothetical protein VHU88_12345 [Sporichthyaceae bacterium]|jgi:hypothetical protein|nr:hypothetical protein [Sporichthyaceae bacterium]
MLHSLRVSRVEAISGTSVLNGIPVRLAAMRPAAAPPLEPVAASVPG